MLRLRQLTALQFKNHPMATHAFSGKVVGICGPNGAGKSSLLNVLSVFGPEGLGERKASAGDYFLRF